MIALHSIPKEQGFITQDLQTFLRSCIPARDGSIIGRFTLRVYMNRPARRSNLPFTIMFVHPDEADYEDECWDSTWSDHLHNGTPHENYDKSRVEFIYD